MCEGISALAPKKGRRWTVVCAEPSPDALTVIGVSGGFSLNSGKADTVANAGGALSESGA